MNSGRKEGFAAIQNAIGGLGAVCGGGFACAQQACVGCFCSTSISISILGSGASFSYSSGYDWKWDKPIGGQCSGCQSSTAAVGCSRTPGGSAPDGVRRVTAALRDCPGTGGSPIVIDLLDSGLQFTSAAEGVDFDIDADGIPDRVAWTTPGSDLAFLVMDVNRNGLIDGGQELFGDRTVQSDGEHGYKSLLWYDEVATGGNGDRTISRLDLIWNRLMLWHDRNHNGISEASELTRLDDTAIESIDLAFKESRRRDRYGNEARYRAQVKLKEGTSEPGAGRTVGFSFDVFFVFFALAGS